MGSHGGQQNFPFGYQPENIHGMGLPEFIHPGPPPGQPLLNIDESQELNSFLNDFQSQAPGPKSTMPPHFLATGADNFFNMPPNFVGSDTTFAQFASVEPHHLHGLPIHHSNLAHHFDPSFGAQGLPAMEQHHNSLNGGGIHNPAFGAQAYPNPLMGPLHTPAMQPQPTYGPGWQQDFHPPPVPDLHSQRVAFGTDSRFQPTGYAAQINPSDPDMPQLIQPGDWFEASSATNTAPNTQPNTQPNTRPSTQPSSPTWSKKRTFDDYRQQDTKSRNGFVANTHRPSISTSGRPRSSATAKPGSQPPTPRSSKPHTPIAVDPPIKNSPGHDEDAEAEDDDGEDGRSSRSPSPAPWPSNKARPPKGAQPAPTSKLRRKKSASSATPLKPKSKLPRTSSGTARVPLSIEQKKANHTNSEQRRRDNTARAYAELYDLVPELEEMGKQSTMKKLEVVVNKVATVKRRVEELRSMLGLDPATGRNLGGAGMGPGGMARSDVQWH